MYWQGDAGYEAARTDAVWRANTPARYPKIIVQAHNAQDVAAAVRFAANNALKIGVRAGGHSWTSPHLREGSMLIDVSRLDSIEIDAPAKRLWGNGCAQIRAIEVVTAEGELVIADETHHADYLWAVRGSGAGFFGVVTRFYLSAHQLPAVMKHSAYVFGEEVLEDLFTWARNIVPQVPPFVEMVITSTAHDENGNWAPLRLVMSALAICDTDEEADKALALFETCPVVPLAKKRKYAQPSTLDERYVSGTMADPVGLRYGCDNMYTNAPASALVPS